MYGEDMNLESFHIRIGLDMRGFSIKDLNGWNSEQRYIQNCKKLTKTVDAFGHWRYVSPQEPGIYKTSWNEKK